MSVTGAVPHVGPEAGAAEGGADAVEADAVEAVVGADVALLELFAWDEPGPLHAAMASRPPVARTAAAWQCRLPRRAAVWRNIVLPPSVLFCRRSERVSPAS
ncbi:MAG TPA: hypothetical protein VF218_12525 [Acidothermaceae bacterium]